MRCLKYLSIKKVCQCIFGPKSNMSNTDELLHTLSSVSFIDLNQLQIDDGISNTLHLCGHDECMICLEELNHDECILIQCCQCVMHRKCFVLWCNNRKSMKCPLCHNCLSIQ